ncbi:macrophage mannose receptor 1-like [Morone saxatilis]|uniref:macrophage mannose receptor 1-like n=1 Tax=Morone saxatilis TaxID=34816 RepID=UPI0015E1F7BE|nr:macrophage mannose receptor 1-like [Morone saxatilis]
MKRTGTAFVFILLQTLLCLASSNDSPFQLTNKATGFCLRKTYNYCSPIVWTTGDRLLFPQMKKCLGVQGKSVGSEVTLYDCDENSELQKWECRNETLLALKGQELYIELTADNTAVLSRTTGPNNHLTILGSSSGACSRTYREYYTIGGNANGRTCMFPFKYKDIWFTECTTFESPERSWCAVETQFERELWGFCPSNSKQHWQKHLTSGAYYQFNTHSALTWSQAETSCKQQGASLLSITDPNQHAYVTVLLRAGGRGQGDKLWTGLIQDTEHGWHWSNGKPYRYLNWDNGHPSSGLGHNCAIVNSAVDYSWQSSTCTKRLGYICYSEGGVAPPTQAVETGFCSSPWIPYNGHCFLLNRTRKTWLEAQKACRREGGDLVSIHNLEEQSFVVSQLGYASTDELWIGLNDRKTEKLFDWTDHSTVSFTSWEFGRPTVFSDQGDCVLMRGENGNWAERACDQTHGFICMMTSASEPTGEEVEQNAGCNNGWKRHGSYCYFVGTETKTFDEAKAVCESSSSYLADVSNGVDNAFLVSLVGLRSEKYFWLGLSNQQNTDEFVWTNTDSVRFTHWNTGMPGHQKGCVAMTTGIFAGLWEVLPCTNKEKYICKHLAQGAGATPAPVTVPPPRCADGWTRVISRNYCYKLYLEPQQKKTWYEARDYCRAIGGDLLSIHSAAELQVGERLGYGQIWIGLSAPDPVTGYVWSDGSPVNYQHWRDGEPDIRTNVDSCAEMKISPWVYTNLWRSKQCAKYNGWLCQIRTGVTPKPPPPPVTPDYNETSDGWLVWNENQYYINKEKMAMEDARLFCQKRHGDLVTINSKAESDFLWKRMQMSERYAPYWIGLTVDLDGTFEWMDGSQVVFEIWDQGQPDFKNYDENCAVMTHDGFWHDYNCGYEHKSICKRRSSPPANTTVAPTVAPQGGCPRPWKKMNSKCYNIITNQKVTWDQGRKQCQDMGGNLVSIPSRHVEVFLTTQMAHTPTSDLWIGFRNLKGHEYYWTDGKPRRYVNMGLVVNCAVINTNPSFGIGKWIQKSCNDTNGFICHRNVDPHLPDSPEPTITDYVKILNDSVKVVTQQMTWDEAKKHCENDGAKLTNIRNEWLQAYVELLALNLNAPLWIGLNKVQTDGYFRYIDGWHMKFTSWDNDEPMRERPCVYVDVDGKWKTAYCNQTMNSVCIKSTDVPPKELTDYPGVCPEDPDTSGTGKKYFWLPFKGYCYIFFTEVKEWAPASASCSRHGGSLVSIEDPSEQEFIQNNARDFQDSHASFWIGLYKTHKGEWLWVDRTVMDYTNWGEGQPNKHIHAVISTLNGTWKGDHERNKRAYICKTPKVLPPTPLPTKPHVLFIHHRGHMALVVVGVITAIAIGAVIALFIFKKKGHRLPVIDKLTTFDNPLFFNNEQLEPGVVDTNKLVENAEEENPEPLLTV